jgi:hypothetical protein
MALVLVIGSRCGDGSKVQRGVPTPLIACSVPWPVPMKTESSERSRGSTCTCADDRTDSMPVGNAQRHSTTVRERAWRSNAIPIVIAVGAVPKTMSRPGVTVGDDWIGPNGMTRPLGSSQLSANQRTPP